MCHVTRSHRSFVFFATIFVLHFCLQKEQQQEKRSEMSVFKFVFFQIELAHEIRILLNYWKLVIV